MSAGETWGDVYARQRRKGMDASDAAFRADEWERRSKGVEGRAFYGCRPMTAAELSDRLMKIASYLAWSDPSNMRGGVRAEDAFAALCDMFRFDPAHFRSMVRGDDRE